MTYKSVADIFQLPPVARNGFYASIPFHPLALVAAPKGADPEQGLVVVGYEYDLDHRAIKEQRGHNVDSCHTFIWAVSDVGTAPVCAGFWPEWLRPAIEEGDDDYPLLNIEEVYNGCVIDQSHCISDSSVAFPVSRQQARLVQAAIQQWDYDGESYQALGEYGKNCDQRVEGALAAAGLRLPDGLGKKNWPANRVKLLEQICADSLLAHSSGCLLQPGRVTQTMYARLQQ